MGKIKKFILDNLFVIAMIAIACTNLFVVGVMKTEGESMEPTVHEGSFVIVQKACYTPERNDVVVAWPGTYPIIKRVVGMPGETVEVTTDGVVLVNGEEYDDKLNLSAYIDGADYVGKEITLGDNEYFLLGDNRPHSKDSRMIGPVSGKKIVGKVVYIFDGEEDPFVSEEN